MKNFIGYTRKGLRVISTAYKKIELEYEDLHHISRDELETHLIFNGFIIFQNEIKPETMPVIETLKEVDIRTIMVTGDNILTATSVAGTCGMVDETDSVIQVSNLNLI